MGWSTKWPTKPRNVNVFEFSIPPVFFSVAWHRKVSLKSIVSLNVSSKDTKNFRT